MKVTDIPFDFAPYLEARFSHASRSSGLHVSKIYGDLDRTMNAKRYEGEMSEAQLNAFAQIGFLWERILEDKLSEITVGGDPARYSRIGEIVVDGVALTPDYCDWDFFGDNSCVLGLEEWKVAWKSVNAWDNFPMEKNFWRWLVQKKAYCYAMGTCYARLRAVFIVGDWKQDISPKSRMREFEFTVQELEDNWAMLMRHAKGKGWR